MNKERPILFNDEMILAILEGRKTQTRRVVKGIDHDLLDMTSEDIETGSPNSELLELLYGPSTNDDGKPIPDQWLVRCTECPEEGVLTLGQGYGKPGDRLWVRETFGYRDDGRLYYRADQTLGQLNVDRWKPSIHMPRWASRITLEITGVRVERLQDISDGDAQAEGAQHFPDLPGRSPYGQDGRWSMEQPTSVDQCLSSPRWAFANYFSKIAGKAPKGIHDPEPWDANPWVWVIEFQRIDQEAKAA